MGKELCDLFLRAYRIAEENAKKGKPGHFLLNRNDGIRVRDKYGIGEAWSLQPGTFHYLGETNKFVAPGLSKYFTLICNEGGNHNPVDFAPVYQYEEKMQIQANGKFPEFFLNLEYNSNFPPMERNAALQFGIRNLAPELMKELEQILAKESKHTNKPLVQRLMINNKNVFKSIENKAKYKLALNGMGRVVEEKDGIRKIELTDEEMKKIPAPDWLTEFADGFGEMLEAKKDELVNAINSGKPFSINL